jgi:lipopolysaccharide transport system permease protein
MKEEKDQWTYIIRSRTGWFNFGFLQLWGARDLISLFVKRDFITTYKQTLLGPAWNFIQPVLSSLIYTFVFSFLARLSTQDVPPVLFYLSGIVPWTYFYECVSRNSNIFLTNSSLFGKVYFPRLAVPVSIVISNLIKFFSMMLLFLGAYLYFYFNGNHVIHVTEYLCLLPLLLLIMASTGMGIGIIISAMTTRYRDIGNLTGVFLQAVMYASPIIFPLTVWPEKLRWIVYANPISSVIETFRLALLGVGSLNIPGLIYSSVLSVFLLLSGIIIFNHSEKNFIDIV